MVSSKVSFSSQRTGQGSGEKSSDGGEDDAQSSSKTASGFRTLCMTIFIFRGQPDTYNNRHVLLYVTSPDLSTFHETVHAQRDDKSREWKVDRMHRQVRWFESFTYLNHVNAGSLLVHAGQEIVPVDIVAAVPVKGRSADSGWNCQTFLLEGLKNLVRQGFQTQEWYDQVEDELLDRLLESTVG